MIETLTTKELIDELMDRHDRMLIVRDPDVKNDPDSTKPEFIYTGGIMSVIGLATWAQDKAIRIASGG